MSIITIAINKKIQINYKIIKTYEAGIVLTGSEIKSIRNNEVTINKSFVIIKKNEAFVIDMIIAKYKFSTTIYTSNIKKKRKLLLHKKEIKKILQRIKIERLTLVPLKIYIKNNYIKLEISLVYGKKKYDKREIIKKRNSKKLIENY